MSQSQPIDVNAIIYLLLPENQTGKFWSRLKKFSLASTNSDRLQDFFELLCTFVG
ncbi:MAG TPA: hypothetical protein V6C85_37255 [Allocoleopsis sp.]